METSKKIADKAHSLFIRYGIRSIRMDDIAAGLGISKKTIYRFYANKNSLVEALVDSAINKHIFRCKKLTTNNDDAIFELYFLLIYAGELYHTLNSAIIHDLEKSHESALKKLKDHKALFLYPTIKVSIEKGIKTGLYRNDFDVSLISRFFLESLTLMSDPEIFPPANRPQIKQSKELFAWLISGIASPAGLETINVYKSQHSLALPGVSQSGLNWDY